MSLYNTDFCAWAESQAALLKAGRFDELDLANLVEEVEDLAGRHRDALASRLEVIVVHLLKLDYSPDRDRNERGWRLTVREQRRQVGKLLRKNPSLISEPSKVLREDYPDMREQAADEADMAVRDFPETCPYTPEQVLDREFWPQG